MKHTQGKWILEENTNEKNRYAVDDDGYPVATVVGETNANLIAAAPEMLEVLKEVVPLFHLMRRFFFKRGISLSDDKVGAGFAFQRLIEKADELIAKAENNQTGRK